MSMYDDLIGQGWTPAQIEQYYPGLAAGGELDLPGLASERSYREDMATLERVTGMIKGGGQYTEPNLYDLQLQLQQHSDIFSDEGLERALTEIGIPSDASLAKYYPQYATGTRYTDAAMWAAADEAYAKTQVYKQSQSYGSSDWGDMLTMCIAGLLGLAGLSLIFGKKR